MMRGWGKYAPEIFAAYLRQLQEGNRRAAAAFASLALPFASLALPFASLALPFASFALPIASLAFAK
ncbi:hypothetical protein [Hallella sp.]|uniref:hypothetical protein n=1 Tax=Hallella sp. TaxID=2980186 RepID=UPI00307B5E93